MKKEPNRCFCESRFYVPVDSIYKRAISLRKHYRAKDVLAPPKGLEPLTDWLTASRSTWLSYGGTACAYALSVSQNYLRLVINAGNAIRFVVLFAWQFPRSPCRT